MSRSLSTAARRALFASETDEAFLILLTFEHADLPAPLRVTSDAVNTVSRGDVFVAFPFDISLPDDDDGKSPRARLAIDNVDRQIVQAVRGLATASLITMEIVRAAATEKVEARFSDFRLTNIEYDTHLIRGDLTVEDFTSEPFPASIFSPGLFPGLF